MAKTDLNFEASMKELEAITAYFESEDFNLDEGLGKFERGMELAGQLQSHLQTIENRVEKIRARFDAGAPTTISSEDDPFNVDPDSLID